MTKFERNIMTTRKRNRESWLLVHRVQILAEIWESRPTQWATLEELLDKLLFLSVSGDGAQYFGFPH